MEAEMVLIFRQILCWLMNQSFQTERVCLLLILGLHRAEMGCGRSFHLTPLTGSMWEELAAITLLPLEQALHRLLIPTAHTRCAAITQWACSAGEHNTAISLKMWQSCNWMPHNWEGRCINGNCVSPKKRGTAWIPETSHLFVNITTTSSLCCFPVNITRKYRTYILHVKTSFQQINCFILYSDHLWVFWASSKTLCFDHRGLV